MVLLCLSLCDTAVYEYSKSDWSREGWNLDTKLYGLLKSVSKEDRRCLYWVNMIVSIMYMNIL